MQLAPHLHRIGNDIVASYLIVTDDGITVVDAGLPGHARDLRRELDELGRSESDIRGVVLTHGDVDHLGFAEHLRSAHGIRVFVHAADAARARGEERAPAHGGPWRLGAVTRFLAYAVSKGAARPRHVRDVVEVADGDVLDLPGAPRIVGLPGHSPGSVAVHSPLVDALFVGDALTTRNVLTGQRGPQPAPFTDDAGAADAALDRIAAEDASWILPGHGDPWRGTPSDIAAAVRAAAAG